MASLKIRDSSALNVYGHFVHKQIYINIYIFIYLYNFVTELYTSTSGKQTFLSDIKYN